MNVLRFNEYVNESKTTYDKYLMDEDFMKFFNKFKNRILELYPNHQQGVLDLMIDDVYTLYHENMSVDDVVNSLYKSPNVPSRD